MTLAIAANKPVVTDGNPYSLYSDPVTAAVKGVLKQWVGEISASVLAPFVSRDDIVNTLRTGIFFLYINHKSLIQSKVTFF
jgi:hypothetical protein